MNTWFTADTHFGHENIIKFSGRPFRSANHMDAVLIENLWAKVGPQDALWIVGDFAFGEKAKDLDWLEKIFNKLPGAEKHLVVGNHDGDHSKLADAFRSSCSQKGIKLGAKNIETVFVNFCKSQSRI